MFATVAESLIRLVSDAVPPVPSGPATAMICVPLGWRVPAICAVGSTSSSADVSTSVPKLLELLFRAM